MQPANGVKPKIKEHKLRSWHGTWKQKGVQQELGE